MSRLAKVGRNDPSDLVQQPSAPALFLSLAYRAHRASKSAEGRIKFTKELMGSGWARKFTYEHLAK
jgi:hypothetical protein